MTSENLNSFVDFIEKKRITLLGIIIVPTLAALIYSITATEIYKTSIYIIPPQQKDINALNITTKDGRRLVSLDSEIGVNEVYNTFMVNAQSRKYQRDFFFDNNIYQYFDETDHEKSFESFHKNMSFRLQSKVLSREVREEKFLTVSFLHTNSQEAADFLNQYINTVILKTSNELAKGINKLISKKRDVIQGEVDSKINLAKQITKDRIVQLEEALIIASKLNIKSIQSSVTNQQSVIMTDENLINNNPLYLYGVDALQVEIETLRTRESEESFVPGLRALQQKVEALEIIQVNPTEVSAAQIDQKALPNQIRHSPKRKLIVFLGFIFGIFLSLMYIFYNLVVSYNKQ